MHWPSNKDNRNRICREKLQVCSIRLSAASHPESRLWGVRPLIPLARLQPKMNWDYRQNFQRVGYQWDHVCTVFPLWLAYASNYMRSRKLNNNNTWRYIYINSVSLRFPMIVVSRLCGASRAGPKGHWVMCCSYPVRHNVSLSVKRRVRPVWRNSDIAW